MKKSLTGADDLKKCSCDELDSLHNLLIEKGLHRNKAWMAMTRRCSSAGYNWKSKWLWNLCLCKEEDLSSYSMFGFESDLASSIRS